jgi:chromosome segregation ATPase
MVITSTKQDIVDQQIDDLRGRIRLLQQERRANVDSFETNRDANSQEIRALREENKGLRQKLTQLQKMLFMERGDQSEITSLRKEAIQLRSEHDSLKVTSGNCKQQIEKLQGELKICKLESSGSSGSSNGDSNAKRLNMLETK